MAKCFMINDIVVKASQWKNLLKIVAKYVLCSDIVLFATINIINARPHAIYLCQMYDYILDSTMKYIDAFTFISLKSTIPWFRFTQIV